MKKPNKPDYPHRLDYPLTPRGIGGKRSLSEEEKKRAKAELDKWIEESIKQINASKNT